MLKRGHASHFISMVGIFVDICCSIVLSIFRYEFNMNVCPVYVDNIIVIDLDMIGYTSVWI